MTGEIPFPMVRPGQNCVYFLRHRGVIIYVGITNGFYSRLSSHIHRSDIVFDSVSMLPVATRARASYLEDKFIRCLRPKYNRCKKAKSRGAKALHTRLVRTDIATQLKALAVSLPT